MTPSSWPIPAPLQGFQHCQLWLTRAAVNVPTANALRTCKQCVNTLCTRNNLRLEQQLLYCLGCRRSVHAGASTQRLVKTTQLDAHHGGHISKTAVPAWQRCMCRANKLKLSYPRPPEEPTPRMKLPPSSNLCKLGHWPGVVSRLSEDNL